MSPDTIRQTTIRGTLLVLVLFFLALLALYPGAALRAQGAPAAAPTVVADSVDGEVSDMVVKGKQLEVRYRNTGRVVTELVGEIQVRDADDALVAAVPLVESRRVAPGRRETFRAPMPALPPGRYTIYAVVDFGGPAMTAAQAPLEVRE